MLVGRNSRNKTFLPTIGLDATNLLLKQQQQQKDQSMSEKHALLRTKVVSINCHCTDYNLLILFHRKKKIIWVWNNRILFFIWGSSAR